MHTQTTPAEIIEHEKATVRRAIGLAPQAAVALNDRGWDSRVYNVQDGKYFFKFPRSAKIRGRYAVEVAALKLAAQNSFGIAIPKVLWQEADYFGYEGVAGESLRAALPTLTTDELVHVGELLGAFLKWFHAQKLAGAREISITKEIAQFQEWFEPAIPTLQNELDAAAFRKLQRLVADGWPAELQRLGRDAALCHGDLHLPNILYDQKIGRLGIIDFGDVGSYDRSKDLLEFEDETLTAAVFEAYGVNDLLRQKIKLRCATTNILTLTFCIGKQDANGIRAALERIRQTL